MAGPNAAERGPPRRDAVAPMKMIEPLPSAFIAGITACAHKQRAIGVDPPGFLELGRRDRLDIREHPAAGVVDEYLGLAEIGAYGGERGGDRVRRGQVAGIAPAFDLLRELIERVAAAREQGDVVAGGCEAPRGRGADARPDAGDNGEFGHVRASCAIFARLGSRRKHPTSGPANASVRDGESRMDLQLKGKRALVSGSTAGIGYAIAQALAREGARVIVNGRTPEAVEKAVAQLKSETGGEVEGFAGDLGEASAAEALAARHPDVEILVNNLGIFEAKPFEQIPDEDWMRFFAVNVLSGVRLARLYLPAMKKADWGRIIFISSESGVQIPAEMIHYGVTKTAQLAVSRGLAESVAGTGITVNCVLPGPTRRAASESSSRGSARRRARPFEEVEKDSSRKCGLRR